VEFIISIGLSLTFGLFWMWWFYRRDIYEKEPKRFVAAIFVAAMPLSFLTGLLEYTLDPAGGGLSEQQGFWVAALFNLGVVAVLEELAKFSIVFFIAYPNRTFNESMDGIVYAAAAALGFASFENAFYVLDKGPLILILRGPFSTLGHVLFSALWGSALGLTLHETERSRQVRLIVIGLLLSILAHGCYNILISFSQPIFPGPEWLGLSGVLFLVVLYIVVSNKISQALHLSFFNPANQARQAIQLLRERRRQHQASIGIITDPAIDSPPPAPPRYAPNPYRYRGPARSLVDPPAASQPEPATTICPHCGAANLLDPAQTNCYNCGGDLAGTE
jgi:protease PrsW